MMKKTLYTLIFASLLAVGCKHSSTDNQKQKPDPAGTSIGVSVAGIGDQVSNQTSSISPTTRVAGEPGHIMIDVADFASTKLALFGIVEKSDGPHWTENQRVIDTLEAIVIADGSMIFTKPGEFKYFPEDGLLSLFSLYPSPLATDSPIVLTDNGVDVVSATITVAPTFAKQFDILHAKQLNVSVAQAQGVKLSFDHVMAQLRFKIFRHADVTGQLTKVVVHGVNKATMKFDDLAVTASSLATDSVDFVAYQGAPIQIGTVAQEVGVDPLLLIPGQASISRITMTIDGQEYTSNVPKTWVLAQGKINTVTLELRKFDVRINGEWAVSPWGKGEDHSGNLENNGKVIAVSASMLDGSKAINTAANPTFADIEIDGGYTHKGVAVTVNNGVFSTVKFNTGIIHDEPLSLTALKLYTGLTYKTATPIFDGKLTGGVTAGGKKIIIDTLHGGQIKLQENPTTLVNYDINMFFGGFGSGTKTIPYEVSTPTALANIANFGGKTSDTYFDGTVTRGAYFVQVADLDLSGINFAPININGGAYDGNGYVIRNLTISSNQTSAIGLFGTVNNASTELNSIVIESGSITYTNSDPSPAGVGSIVGALANGRVINCLNKSSVNVIVGRNAGGIVGALNGALTRVIGCANYGEVKGRSQIGGIAGSMAAGSQIIDCYNSGAVIHHQQAGLNHDALGGLVGKVTLNTSSVVQNCYNVGAVTTTDPTYSASVFGFVSGAVTPSSGFKNNYVLTGIHAKTVGKDNSSGAAVTARITEKSQADIQASAMVDALNAGRSGASAMWKADADPFINSGYPILIWQ